MNKTENNADKATKDGNHQIDDGTTAQIDVRKITISFKLQ